MEHSRCGKSSTTQNTRTTRNYKVAATVESNDDNGVKFIKTLTVLKHYEYSYTYAIKYRNIHVRSSTATLNVSICFIQSSDRH